MATSPQTLGSTWRLQWAASLAALSLMCSASHAVAQISAEDMHTLVTGYKKGGAPHELAISSQGMESTLRTGPEASKLPGILQLMELAATLYRSRDLSVSTEQTIGRWPDFKVDGKSVFAGAAPESFSDPKVRAAYEKALADHEELLGRVVAERYKLEEGDYCARCAGRVMESSVNPALLKEAIAKHIATMPDAEWIKERLIKILLPKQETNKESAPGSKSPPSQSQ